MSSHLRKDQARLCQQAGLLSDFLCHDSSQKVSRGLRQPKPELDIVTRHEIESLQQRKAKNDKDNYTPSSSNILVRIKGHARTHQDNHCDSACKCACHIMNQSRSPRSVDALLGTLFIGYSAAPFRAKTKCTASECKGNGSIKINMEYLFPLWFLLNVSAKLMISSTGDPAFCLRITRTRTGGHDIKRLITSNDLGSLQSLYSSGRGSPNDVFENGQGALYVSLTKISRTLHPNSEYRCSLCVSIRSSRRQS